MVIGVTTCFPAALSENEGRVALLIVLSRFCDCEPGFVGDGWFSFSPVRRMTFAFLVLGAASSSELEKATGDARLAPATAFDGVKGACDVFAFETDFGFEKPGVETDFRVDGVFACSAIEEISVIKGSRGGYEYVPDIALEGLNLDG